MSEPATMDRLDRLAAEAFGSPGRGRTSGPPRRRAVSTRRTPGSCNRSRTSGSGGVPQTSGAEA